jgi:hypothetical protein
VESPRNEQYIGQFLGMEDVTLLGAIPRRELIQYQLSSDIQIYPCLYDELFCYATAECQVAGALPVTSQRGALVTTNMGVQVAGTDLLSPGWLGTFADAVIETMLSDKLAESQLEVSLRARDRFKLKKIEKEWDKVLDG